MKFKETQTTTANIDFGGIIIKHSSIQPCFILLFDVKLSEETKQTQQQPQQQNNNNKKLTNIQTN